MMKINLKCFYVIAIMFCCNSCQKFLSVPDNSGLANPSTLQDLQAMLDATNVINQGGYSQLHEAATDDFFVGKGGYDRLDDFGKEIYIWNDNYLFTIAHENSNWSRPFHVIAIANTVINDIDRVSATKGPPKEEIEGAARFHRAFAYLNLVQIYCKSYDVKTANSDLGLPLRYSSDLTDKVTRSSLHETYSAIESDILKAISLMPVISLFKTRPNKLAGYALLARLYLIMEKYDKALEAANKVIENKVKLMDFNLIDPKVPFPFEPMNEETIFFAYSSGASILNPSRECYIDTVLFASYEEHDLRKDLFFKSENNGYYSFRGSYIGIGSSSTFIGLTTSEILLIKAECLVRLGMIEESMRVMNQLLINRFESKYWIPFSESDKELALNFVLLERRKELLFKGVRWSDLKRLNKDVKFSKTIFRKKPNSNEVYKLSPNDNRYVFLIPQIVIEMSGIEQNPR